MTDADIKRLIDLGITSDEIWCAIAEPGPWTLIMCIKPEVSDP